MYPSRILRIVFIQIWFLLLHWRIVTVHTPVPTPLIYASSLAVEIKETVGLTAAVTPIQPWP